MQNTVICVSQWGGTGLTDSVEAFTSFKVATGTAPRTTKDYRGTLGYFFRLFPDAWKGPLQMRAAFLSWISEDISPSTYNLRLIYLRAFWRWTVEEGIQPERPDPFRGLKRRNAPGKFRDIDAGRIAELLTLPDKTTWAGLRDYALILFTLDTAARPGEALQLLPEHINFRSMVATIPAAAAKTREERIIPFSPATAAVIKKFLHARPPEWRSSAPVFSSENGGRFSVSAWHGKLSRYRLQDGSCFRPYDLRHAACTLHLRAGMSGEALQRLMGHHGPQMTQRYIHLTIDDLRAQQALSSPVEKLVPTQKRAPRKIQK